MNACLPAALRDSNQEGELLLRLLADEDFKRAIVRGVLRVRPDIDLVRFQCRSSADIAIDTARQLQLIKREYPRLDIQTAPAS